MAYFLRSCHGRNSSGKTAMNDPLSVLASFLVSVAIAAGIADASQAAMHALAKRKAPPRGSRRDGQDS